MVVVKRFLVPVFVFGTLLVFLVGCSEKKGTESEYLEKAKLSLDAGDYRATIIQLKNALNLQPDSAQGRFMLGELYVSIGDGPSAETELLKALARGVSVEAVTPLLGDALLMQGKTSAILKQMQHNGADSALLKTQKIILLGEAYIDRGEREKAESLLNAVTSPPALVNRAQLALARIMISEKKSDQAIVVIQQVISADQGNARAWVTLADAYRGIANSEKVVEAYREAVKKSKSIQDFFYLVAMRGIVAKYLEGGKTAEAERELEILKKSYFQEQFPNLPDINHLRSVLAFQKKEYDTAGALAEKVLKVSERHLGATLILGATSVFSGRLEQAQELLSRFLAAVPGHKAGTRLLAMVQLKRGQSGLAVKTLTPLVKGEGSDVELLAMIAGASLLTGDAQSSVQYYQKALAEKPDTRQFRAGLAEGLLALGRVDKAIEELEKIKSGNGTDAGVDLAIIETHIKAKNYVEALKRLEQLAKSQSSNPLPVSLVGTVHVEMGQLDQAKIAFEKALSLKSGFPPAARSLSELYVKKKDFASAEKILDSALVSNSGSLVLMYDLARLAVLRQELPKAEQILRKAIDVDKTAPQSVVLLAQVLMQMQKPSQALTELRGLGSVAGRSPAVLAEIGNAQMMMGEYVNAVISFEKFVESESNAGSNFLLYTALLANGAIDKAKKSLAVSLQKDEHFVPSLIAAVTISLAEKDAKKAKGIVTRIEKLVPGNEAIPLLKAEIALFEKNPRQAIQIYVSTKQWQEKSEIVQRLSQSYWMAGDQEKALATLDDAIMRRPNDLRLKYTLATAYDSMGEKNKAIELYKKVIQNNDQHLLALNNLAWLIKDTDLQAAERYAQKAASLAPNNADVQDTLRKIQALSRR